MSFFTKRKPVASQQKWNFLPPAIRDDIQHLLYLWVLYSLKKHLYCVQDEIPMFMGMPLYGLRGPDHNKVIQYRKHYLYMSKSKFFKGTVQRDGSSPKNASISSFFNGQRWTKCAVNILRSYLNWWNNWQLKNRRRSCFKGLSLGGGRADFSKKPPRRFL